MKLYSTLRAVAPLALLAATIGSLQASHGQNFLLLEDYDIPAPGHGQLSASFDWEHADDESYSTEPGVLYGILPHAALGFSAHFADEAGAGWDYSSVSPRLYLRLPADSLPFQLGLSVGYQFAKSADEDHGEEEGAGHDEAEMEGHTHHEHGGIDNHDASLWHTRLLLETDLTESTKLVANVIGVFPESGSAAWGYGIGIRQQLTDTISGGLEARGDFGGGGQHELLAGAYWSPIHDFTLRLGCGIGLTEESPDFVLHSGVIWRF